MKKTVSFLLSLIMLICILCAAPFDANAAAYKEKLRDAGFPESYISDLAALHKSYPEWEFKPFKTGLSFYSAVSSERSSHSKQCIESGYSDKYYCTCSKCSSYSGSWLRPASQWAVEYFMDPRNWLDEKHIFQFETNTFSDNQTQAAVESIISLSFMHDTNITYINTEGETVTYKNEKGKKVKFSKAIMEAAKAANISAYYIASRIVKEVGAYKPTASGTAGNKKPFIGIYNYYSIGAGYGGMAGLEWAAGWLRTEKETTLYSKYNSDKDKGAGDETSLPKEQYMCYIGTYGKYFKVRLYYGSHGSYSTGATGYVKKSALRTTYFNYNRPWTSPYKSIVGGAAFIADNYLDYQYTSYLEKFNVNPDSPEKFGHEYMQNVDAPSLESKSRYKAYTAAGELKTAKTFYIPVYKDMPDDDSTSGGNNDGNDTGDNQNSTSKVKNVTVTLRTPNKIAFKWDAVKGASQYYIFVKNLTHGNTFDKTVTTAYTNIKGLNPGNRYSIKVRAYKKGSWGSYSDPIKARAQPARVKITDGTSPSSGKLKISWKKQSYAKGYIVHYSRKKDFSEIIAKKDFSSDITSYTGKNFTKDVKYYIRVRSYIVVNSKRVYGSWSKTYSIISK